jgi:hypothetical protein
MFYVQCQSILSLEQWQTTMSFLGFITGAGLIGDTNAPMLEDK